MSDANPYDVDDTGYLPERGPIKDPRWMPSLRPGRTLLAVLPIYFTLALLAVPLVRSFEVQDYWLPIGMALLGLAVIVSAFVTRRKVEPIFDEDELV